MKFNIILITTIFSSILTGALAQTARETAVKRMRDSMKFEAVSEYAKSYPQLRQGFLTADIIGQGHVKAELKGKDLYEGDMKVTRIRSNFNIPLVQWGNNSFFSSIGYQLARFETTNIKSYDPGYNFANQTITKTRVGLNATYTRSDSLFTFRLTIPGV